MDVRTLAEVRDAITALSVADWGRLKHISVRYAFGGAIDPDDLLQEAIKRSLEKNGRACPKDIEIVKFLAGAMRSIASGEREKPENRVAKILIGSDQGDASCVDPADGAPNAEQLIAEFQEDASTKSSLLSLFSDDRVACDLIEAIWLGYEGGQLRELLGLEKVDYDSKRKLMRRRIRDKYPNGRKV